MEKQNNKYKGFTLVEVMVSAVILSVAVVAIVVVMRKAQEIQLSDKHYQEVRALLNSRFEKDYDYRKYNEIRTANRDEPVTIDSSSGTPLVGRLYTHIDSTTENASGSQISVKKVKLSIAWKEIDRDRDSMSLVKWITE